MRSFIALFIIVILMGCEATPVKNANQIKTKVKLNTNFALPLNLPVSFYVDKSKPGQRKINFYGKLEEAAELVFSDIFEKSSKLKQGAEIAYLIELSAISEWDYFWGGYKSDFKYVVKSPDGNVVFHREVETKASGAGGFYDINAVYNDFAKSIKELTYSFLNQNSEKITAMMSRDVPHERTNLAILLPDLRHSSSGTGFFVSDDGMIITAAHTIDKCMNTVVVHKGTKYSPTVVAQSSLLDLAVLKTEVTADSYLSVNPSNQLTLGKPLFVTGFPLSDILSDYPSLTVGNVTSLGGLKGAKGSFQFSAPVQPGNSGGAIVDYKGNLLGVVSASLNQGMMLKEAGTVSQNVNFGIDVNLLSAFVTRHELELELESSSNEFDFEKASMEAVKYTTQILCYE